MSLGYVYVLSNPRIHNALKIGATNRTVAERARELSRATGVPEQFVVEYFLLTEQPMDVERLVHEALVNFRLQDNREFFDVSIETAIEYISKHAQLPELKFRREATKENRKARICFRCGAQKSIGVIFCDTCGF